VRLLTLNLRQNLDRWPERLPLVVAALAAADADVIGLQEVALPIRQDHLVAAELNRLAPDRPYAVHTAPKWGDSNPEAVSLLSRIPVGKHEVLVLPVGGRVAQRIAVDLEGRPLHIVNTHLHHQPYDDESVREPQLRAILGWLGTAEALGSCVVMGDLNATPESSTLRTSRPSLDSALPTGVPTFPTALATGSLASVQIGHVLYSPGLLLVSASLVAHHPHPADPALYPSDHLGVLAELARRR